MSDTVDDLKKLFEEWSKAHAAEPEDEYKNYHNKDSKTPGYIPRQNFICDGVLFKDKYDEAERKILYIAKECNEYNEECVNKEQIDIDNSNIWLKNEINNKSGGVFVKGLAMLHNAMINNNYTNPVKEISALETAAFLNLNKRGGYSKCYWDTLEKYVEKYKDMIKAEIELIAPDEIVCCGKCVKELVETKKLVSDKSIKIRCAYHPSSFSLSDKAKLYFLQHEKLPEQEEPGDLLTSSGSREVRGYIIDTNNVNDVNDERDMLHNSRVYAYGNARRYLKWFRPGDYALFYSSNKKGVIAIGRVKDPGECDKTDTAWWDVDFIVTSVVNGTVDPNKILSLDSIEEIVYCDKTKKFPMRGKVKRKIITEEQVKTIINKSNEKTIT